MPDEALMKDISRQRHAALTELYGRHGQRLKAMIDSVVHEEAEAGDVLQETLLQIWNEADHYSPKAGKPLGLRLLRSTSLRALELRPTG